MPTPWLLVHSPLLGPGCWRRLITAAECRAQPTIASDCTGFAAADPPHWEAYVDRAVAAANDSDAETVIVVGHSGAGALLPAIGDRLGERLSGLVLVDAVVPQAEGHHHTPADLRPLIDRQRHGDRLAPWPDWWPPEVIAELLPEAADRVAIYDDAPQVPAAFYDEAIPLPDRWTAGPCRYLQLSDAYADDHDRATAYGWPTASLDSTHLGIITAPDDLVTAIAELIS